MLECGLPVEPIGKPPLFHSVFLKIVAHRIRVYLFVCQKRHRRIAVVCEKNFMSFWVIYLHEGSKCLFFAAIKTIPAFSLSTPRVEYPDAYAEKAVGVRNRPDPGTVPHKEIITASFRFRRSTFHGYKFFRFVDIVAVFVVIRKEYVPAAGSGSLSVPGIPGELSDLWKPAGRKACYLT